MANTGTTSDKGCVDIDIYVPQAAGGGGASWAEHGERGARAGVPAAPLRAVLHPGHGLGPLLRRLRQVCNSERLTFINRQCQRMLVQVSG